MVYLLLQARFAAHLVHLVDGVLFQVVVAFGMVEDGVELVVDDPQVRGLEAVAVGPRGAREGVLHLTMSTGRMSHMRMSPKNDRSLLWMMFSFVSQVCLRTLGLGVLATGCSILDLLSIRTNMYAYIPENNRTYLYCQ